MKIKKIINLLIILLLKYNLLFAVEIYIDPFTVFVDQKNTLNLHASEKDVKVVADKIEDSIDIVYQKNLYTLILLNEPKESITDRNKSLP